MSTCYLFGGVKVALAKNPFGGSPYLITVPKFLILVFTFFGMYFSFAKEQRQAINLILSDYVVHYVVELYDIYIQFRR